MRLFRFLFLVVPCVAVAQPRLSLEKPELDLGTIYTGTIATTHLRIKNIGNEPLKILNLQPGCGCTAVKHPKDVLLPDESDDIEIQFNATGYRGHVEKHLFLTTSDPASQMVTIKLVTEVKEELEPLNRTGMLFMDLTPIHRSTTQTLMYRNVSGKTIKVKGTGSSSVKVSVNTDRKTIPPSDTVVVSVTVRPDRAGYEDAHVWLDIDSKNQPRIDLRVSYRGSMP